MTHLEVLLTPAEFATLPQRDLRDSVCVVFDVLRATSTLVTALGHGAISIRPVADIATALAWKQRDPDLLLAGERDGLRIGPDQTGGIDFDFGNSPREFRPERVAGRRIVMTTTNGTRALDACADAGTVLAASFANLSATADWLTRHAAGRVLLIGAGTLEHSAWEDVLGVGALVDRLLSRGEPAWVDDAALVARTVYQSHSDDLVKAGALGRNGRRLQSLPDLAGDLGPCLTFDTVPLLARRDADGGLRAWPSDTA